MDNYYTYSEGYAQAARFEAALEKIADWKMPATGLFWPNEDGIDSDRPMSYGAAYGSNGERDYIRKLAQDALDAG